MLFQTPQLVTETNNINKFHLTNILGKKLAKGFDWLVVISCHYCWCESQHPLARNVLLKLFCVSFSRSDVVISALLIKSVWVECRARTPFRSFISKIKDKATHMKVGHLWNVLLDELILDSNPPTAYSSRFLFFRFYTRPHFFSHFPPVWNVLSGLMLHILWYLQLWHHPVIL